MRNGQYFLTCHTGSGHRRAFVSTTHTNKNNTHRCYSNCDLTRRDSKWRDVTLDTKLSFLCSRCNGIKAMKAFPSHWSYYTLRRRGFSTSLLMKKIGRKGVVLGQLIWCRPVIVKIFTYWQGSDFSRNFHARIFKKSKTLFPLQRKQIRN